MSRAKTLALMLFAVVLIAGGWKEFLSPGALHTSHADIGGDCDQCHLVFDGIPDENCLSCHEGIAALQGTGEGFHSSVADQGCIECHGDHSGPTASLTKEPASKSFAHSSTRFALDGAHANMDCATCHSEPLGKMEAVCNSCHEDPHSSALGQDCNVCHEAVAWKSDLKTVEAHALDMSGKHGKLLCEECHTQGNHLDLEVSCNDCHKDGHGGTTHACSDCHEVAAFKPAEFDHGPCTCAFPGKHQTVECLGCHEDFVFTDSPTECSGCHTDDRPHDDLGGCAQCHTATSWSENRFVHNEQSDFHIDGEHLSVSCSQCHEGGNFKGAPTTCESCHSSAVDKGGHGEFGGCADCHSTEAFTKSTFDHTTSGFELTGKHSKLNCHKCHGEEAPAAE